jgi:two-component system, NarL family, nitrate/nitrite response regulator NarL
MISVVVASRFAAVRAGLKALLDGDSLVVTNEVAGLFEASLEDADVIITDDANLETPQLQAALVVLSDDTNAIARILEIAPRGWALVAPDAPADELRAAVHAAANGLAALPVALTDRFSLEIPTSRATDPDALEMTEDLTARERDVLDLLALGLSNKRIAQRLEIGESTVKFHLAAIYAKFHVSSRTAAVSVAARSGLVTI